MGCSCQTHYESGEVPQRGDVVNWNGFTRTVVSPVGCDSYWCEDGTVQHIPAARLVRRGESSRYASGEEPRVGDVISFAGHGGKPTLHVVQGVLPDDKVSCFDLIAKPEYLKLSQRGPCSKCK